MYVYKGKGVGMAQSLKCCHGNRDLNSDPQYPCTKLATAALQSPVGGRHGTTGTGWLASLAKSLNFRFSEYLYFSVTVKRYHDQSNL